MNCPAPRRPRESRVLLDLALVAAALCLLAPRATLAADPKQVNDALARAVAYLYSVQKPDGTWEEVATPEKIDAKDFKPRQSIRAGQWGGPTALAVYALLAAGEKPQGDRLVKAIDFLKKHESAGVYACGLRCQVWLLLPQTPEVQKAMARDAGVLLKTVKTEGDARGMYDYVWTGPGGKGGGAYSHSRAQYGVLGLWAAEQAGAKVPDAFWGTFEKSWIDHQDASGGWSYTAAKDPKRHPLTPGMTAVGVATLFITQDYVHAEAAVACRGNQSNPAIEKGLKWMADNMDKVATDETYDRDFHYPTLYAVERIGLASGLKYLGTTDWYDKGASWLLKKQNKNGGWSGGGTPQVAGLGDTGFAMLFLARGRAPVAFNKLDYAGPPAANAGPQAAAQAPPWNQRPRDVANLTRWLGKSLEADLNWQIINLKAPADDFLDAPILYVSGNKPLTIDAAGKGKLRAFVEQGGLILGNADCGTAAFATGFQKLGSELFPTYEFRELEPNHVIYSGLFPRAKWKVKPAIQGLSNGARELMLLVPSGDPSRFWQTRALAGREEFWHLAANIFMYTNEGRDFRFRGDTHWVNADPAVKPNHAAKVYRLQYSGNWDPEPGGWRRLAGVLHNEHRTALTVETIKLGDGKLPPGKALAHLTGTAKFTLTPAQQAEMKAFVAGGGTLVVDAAGGAGAFADSAERELAAIFGGTVGSLGQILPPDHKAYAAGDGPIEQFGYRRFVRGKIAGQLNAPRMRGLEQGGRTAVFYSREDLSVGLVGNSVDGILGYAPATATDVMSAIVLHAFPLPRQAGKPATKPSSRSTTPPASRRAAGRAE